MGIAGFRPRWPAKETRMRKRRYTEAQIVAILQELDAGRSAAELARKHGVHVNTLRLWRSKYAGLDISDLTRLERARIRKLADGAHHRASSPRDPRDVRGDSKKTGGALSAQGSGEGVRGRGDEPAGKRAASRPAPDRPYDTNHANAPATSTSAIGCVALRKSGRDSDGAGLKILLKREGLVMNRQTPAPPVLR